MGKIFFPILLQFGGVLAIIAEIFLPSGGLLTALAAGLIGYSLYLAFSGISEFAGIVFIAADVIILPLVVLLGLKMIARSRATLRATLSRASGVSSQSPELEKHLGLRGEAVSDLRPSGIAVVEGKRVDVCTRGEYIGKGTPIYVSAVTGNQIIVREREAETT